MNSRSFPSYIAFCIGCNFWCKLYKKRYERQKALNSFFQTARVETCSTGAFSQSKETKMFKNRFLLVLGVLSLLLVATAVSLPLSNATNAGF
jgi:hypothetical protein